MPHHDRASQVLQQTKGLYDNAINPATGIEYTDEDLEKLRKEEEEELKLWSKSQPDFHNQDANSNQAVTDGEANIDRIEDDPYWVSPMIDPLTGVPFTKSDWISVQNGTRTVEGEELKATFKSQSTYNIDVDDYSKYMDQIRGGIGQTELDRRRAVGQSGWDQAGNAVVRTVGGAVMDFVGGMASMIDVEDYYNQDDEVGNPIQRQMDEWKDKMNEEFAIHREHPEESFDFGDPGWWYENGSSLVSSIAAFAAQGAVVGGTLGAGAAGLTANMAKWVQKLAQGTATVTTAAGLNQTEAIMEASRVYSDNLAYYQTLGATEAEAKSKASDDAANVVSINRANIALNLTGASMFTRAGKQLALSRQIMEKPVSLFSKKGLGILGREGAQEFAEEQVNYIAEYEGKRGITGLGHSNILSAIVDGRHMGRHADDPHFWEAGVLGAIGGMGQAGGGHVYRRASGKKAEQLAQYNKQEQRIRELDAMITKGTNASELFLKGEELNIAQQNQKEAEIALEEAVKEGDVDKIETAQEEVSKAQDYLLYKQTLLSLNDGTTEHLINAYKAFENLTDEQIREKQMLRKDEKGNELEKPQSVRDSAAEAIRFIEEMEVAYNTMDGKSPKIRNKAVRNRTNNFIAKQKLSNLKTQIAAADSTIAEERSLYKPGDPELTMTDAELAMKNGTVKMALYFKRAAEKEFDSINRGRLKNNKAYKELLAENFGKRGQKRYSAKNERIGRGRKAFKEKIEDIIFKENISLNELIELRRSVALANHPDKVGRLEILDGVISQLNEEENYKREQEDAATLEEVNKEVRKHIREQAKKVGQELGLSDKTIDAIEENEGGGEEGEEAAEALGHSPSVKTEDEETPIQEAAADGNAPSPNQPTVGQIATGVNEDGSFSHDMSAESEIASEEIPTNKTLEELPEETKKTLNPLAQLALEANTLSDIEYVEKNAAEDGEVFAPHEKALIEERKKEIKDFLAKKEAEKKEAEEIEAQAQDAGVSIEVVTAVQESSQSDTDEKISDPLEPTLVVDETTQSEEEEASEEATTRTANAAYSISSGTVPTVNTQDVTINIADPKDPNGNSITKGLHEKGLHIVALDENGNTIDKPATRFRRMTSRQMDQALKKGEITKEQLAAAVPLHWFPIMLNPQTGEPVLRQGSGMEKFMYVKKDKEGNSALVPLRQNAMKGDPVFLVHENPNDIVLEAEVIDFKAFSEPTTASKGSFVYLKKGQYVYPKNHPRAGEEIWTALNEDGTVDPKNEVITVHLTPDGPAVQKIAAGDFDLRMNFDNYQDKDGNVKMFVQNKNRGYVINLRGPDGNSVKNPLANLGELNEDYRLGVGRAESSEDTHVMYWDPKIGKNGGWAYMSAKVEPGRVYAMIPSSNGQLVPVRLETNKISRKDAEIILDKILLSDKSGKEKQRMLQSVIGQPPQKNIEGEEDPDGPLFFVDQNSIKLRIGEGPGHFVIAIDHTGSSFTGGKSYHNLKQALAGEQFQVRLFHSAPNSPHGAYGTPAMEPHKEDPTKSVVMRPFLGGSNVSNNAEVQNAIENMRETIITSIMGKAYQVNKSTAATSKPGIKFTDWTGNNGEGKEYNSYGDYLADKEVNGVKGVITTDLPAGQKFTGAKVHLVSTEKEALMVNPDKYTVVSQTDEITPEQLEAAKQGNEMVSGSTVDAGTEEQNAGGVTVSDKDLTDANIKEDTNLEGEGRKITGDPGLPGMDDDTKLRAVSKEIEKQYEQDPSNILTEAEITWITETFGPQHILPMANAKFLLMKNGEAAYGAYSNGLIQLARLGAKGTAYHESFHLVMDLATTEEEKKQVFLAMQKKYGTFSKSEEAELRNRHPKKTTEELQEIFYEEQAAELFRAFMEAEESAGRIPKTKLGKAIQKIFDRIRKLLLSIQIYASQLINPDSMYLSTLRMNKMFLNIKSGDFKISEDTRAKMKDRKFNPNDFKLRRKKGWTEDQKSDVVNSLRYTLMMKVLPQMIKEGKTKAVSVKELLTKKQYINDLKTGIESTRARIEGYNQTLLNFIEDPKNAKSNALKEAKVIQEDYVSRIFTKDQWEDDAGNALQGGVVKSPGFKSLLIKSLAAHGVQVKNTRAKNSMTDEEWTKLKSEVLIFGEVTVEEDSDETSSKERVHDQHFALSDPKKTLQDEIKIALSFIQAPTIKDANGNIISRGTSSYTNLEKFIDFDTVFAELASKMTDVTQDRIAYIREHKSQAMSKLEELSQWNPSIASIWRAFQTWDDTTKNQFRATFSKTQLKFITAIINKKGAWELIETNRVKQTAQIRDRWNSNKRQRGLFTESIGKDDAINTIVLKEVGEKFNYLFNKKLQENPKDYYAAVADVFSYIGIDFNPEIQQMLAAKYPPEQFQSTYVAGKFTYILRDMGYNTKTNEVSANGVNPYTSSARKGQIKNIDSIADLVVDISIDMYAGSFTNGEGQMVYSINLNSYLSKFKTGLKSDKLEDIWKEFAKDVFYNPDNTGINMSILFDLLQQSPKMREEFDIIELDSLKKERGDEAISYDKMNPKQSWLTRLAMYNNNGNNVANGYMFINTGTKSDKGRSLYMKVPVLAFENHDAPLHQLVDNSQADKLTKTKHIAKNLLLRNVMQERARIKLTEEQLFGENALSDSELIENLHYSPKLDLDKDGNFIPGFREKRNGNGLKFISFPDLNFSNYNLFDSKGNVKNFTKTQLETIKGEGKALDTFLEREISRGLEAMKEAGLLIEYEGKYYSNVDINRNPEISSDKLGLDNASKIEIEDENGRKISTINVDEVLRIFLINDLTWRTEFSKFENGDLALYKSKETDISNNPEFAGSKGKFISVVTDAGKRAYQSITPGLDHIIAEMYNDNTESQDSYGKSKLQNMIILKDVYSKMSIKNATAMALHLTSDTNWSPKAYLQDLEKSTKNLTTEQKEAIKIARAYRSGSNKADAQGFTSLEAHRGTMMGRGEWTMGLDQESHEAAYQKYWKTEPDVTKWAPWARKLALKPLKTFAWGYRFDENLQKMVFTQIKHSTVPLYPAFTKINPNLDKLRQRMEATGEFEGLNKIDVVNMESAVKVGKKGTIDYKDLKDAPVYIVSSENERTPFVLPSEKGTDPKDGSQTVKLITANMPPGAVYTTIQGIKEMTTEAIKDVNDKVYVQKIKNSADKLDKRLGFEELQKNPYDRDAQLKFLHNVQQILEEQIEARELPDNYSLSLEIKQLESGEYAYAMPLSFPAYAKKFEIAIASLYKSMVMTQRLPGDAAVQVAEHGLDENNDLGYYYFSDGTMKAAEVAISYTQAKRMGIDKYVNKETGAIDYKAMEKDGMDRSVLEIVGYRIPTQGKSSMLPLIVKKILPPTAKGQIVLPADITTQTGADFDVDKLFLYYPALEKTTNSKGEIIFRRIPVAEKMQQIADGKLNTSELSEQEIQNILFNIRFGILTSKHNWNEVVNPLDSDTYSKKMEEYEKLGLLEDLDTMNFNSAYTDVHLESINKDAKMLVGIFSSHSVAQAISQDIDIQTSSPVYIKVKDDKASKEQGKDVYVGTKDNSAGDLTAMFGFDGILRSIYTNENQNAALENAKDPITGSLNINSFTANVVAYLNRLGYNNSITTDLVNQPIIRELTKDYLLDDTSFTPNSTAAALLKNLGMDEITGPNGKKIQYKSAEENRIEITPEKLQKMLGKSFDEMTEAEKQFQKQVLVDFVTYWTAGMGLAKSNKMLAPDRFTTMSGLSDIELWKNNKQFVEEGKGPITVTGVYSENSSSPRLNAYYEHAILGAEALISHFMPYNSQFFLNIKRGIAEVTHQKDGYISNKELLDQINNDIFSFVMYTQNSPVKHLFQGVNRQIMQQRLYSKGEGNTSTASTVTKVKAKYALESNKLLGMISADPFNSRNAFQMVKFNNAASYGTNQKSELVDAFYELLYHTERVVNYKKDFATSTIKKLTEKEKKIAVKEVKDMMVELVQYIVATSGFQSGPNSMIDLVPIEVWQDLSLGELGETAGLSQFLRGVEKDFKNIFSESLSRYTLTEEQVLEDEGVSGIPEISDQILRNRVNNPRLFKKVQAGKLENHNELKHQLVYATKKVAQPEGSKIEILGPSFIQKFKVTAEVFPGLYTGATSDSNIAGFPDKVVMWDSKNFKRRLYRKTSSWNPTKSDPKTHWAIYEVEESLGEEGKFFEVVPDEMYPKSMAPDNRDINYTDVGSKASAELAEYAYVPDPISTEEEALTYTADMDPGIEDASDVHEITIDGKSMNEVLKKEIDKGNIKPDCE